MTSNMAASQENSRPTQRDLALALGDIKMVTKDRALNGRDVAQLDRLAHRLECSPNSLIHDGNCGAIKHEPTFEQLLAIYRAGKTSRSFFSR